MRERTDKLAPDQDFGDVVEEHGIIGTNKVISGEALRARFGKVAKPKEQRLSAVIDMEVPR